jgi:hypothetical protein
VEAYGQEQAERDQCARRGRYPRPKTEESAEPDRQLSERDGDA